MFEHGDRVRCSTTGDDGLPLVRYGFVRSVFDNELGPVVVMLDGEINSEVLALDALEAVAITTVELRLTGEDLLAEEGLRRGLLSLWTGEAESAGLDVSGWLTVDDQESPTAWTLATLRRGDDDFVLRAYADHVDPETIHIRAERS